MTTVSEPPAMAGHDEWDLVRRVSELVAGHPAGHGLCVVLDGATDEASGTGKVPVQDVTDGAVSLRECELDQLTEDDTVHASQLIDPMRTDIASESKHCYTYADAEGNKEHTYMHG